VSITINETSQRFIYLVCIHVITVYVSYKTIHVVFICLALACAEMCFETSQCDHEICDDDYTLECVFGECTCGTGKDTYNKH